MSKLAKLVIKNHKIPRHTQKVLVENRLIKDFCENSRVFALLPPEIGIHYNVNTWFVDDTFLVKIESIGLYKDTVEYNNARMAQLSSAKDKDFPDWN